MRWLVARDPEAILRFAPLGGDTFEAHGLSAPRGGEAFDTLLYLRDGAVLTRSRAFFALLKDIRSGWRWLRVFAPLPAWLTDLPYRLIARLRLRLFGRADACAIPAPAERVRFLS